MVGQARHRPHEMADHADVRGPGRDLDLDVGRRGGGGRHDPRASSRDANIGNTFDRPVMSKIFRIRSWLATSFIEPSLSFTRFNPPTRTPRPVESRKSTRS